MEWPIGGPVAAGLDGSQLEDSLGVLQPPTSAGDVHPVSDKMTAGPFDDAGRDGKPERDEAPVVEEGRALQQVVRSGIELFSALSAESSARRRSTDGGDRQMRGA